MPAVVPSLIQLKHFHDFARDNQDNKKMITIAQYTICSVLVLPSAYILFRACKIRERSFLVLVTSLLLIGSVAGIIAAYYMQ